MFDSKRFAKAVLKGDKAVIREMLKEAEKELGRPITEDVSREPAIIPALRCCPSKDCERSGRSCYATSLKTVRLRHISDVF